MTSVKVHTRTHTVIPFANPFIQCGQCREWATEFHSPEMCGTAESPCPMGFRLMPCGHFSETISVCPSWSPVDDCDCKRFGISHIYPPHKKPDDAVFVLKTGVPVWIPETQTLYVTFGLSTSNDKAEIQLIRADKYDRMMHDRITVNIDEMDKL